MSTALLTQAITFSLYLLVVLIIGAYSYRFNRTITDYFLAGRKLGSWVSAISSTASSESGWVTLGAVGMAYSAGISAIWFVPGCLLGYVFNWYFLAPRLRRFSRENNTVTVPDHLEEAYGDDSHILRIVAVVIIFLSMMTYVAAQFQAAGKALDASFGIPYKWGVLTGAFIVIVYTLSGGFRAVSWTDLLQGLFMVVGLIIIPVMAMIKLGGPVELGKKLASESSGSRLQVRLGEEGERKLLYLKDSTESFELEGKTLVKTADGKGAYFRIQQSKNKHKLIPTPGENFKINGEKMTEESVILRQDTSISSKKLGENKIKIKYRRKNDLVSLAGGETGFMILGLIVGLFGIGLGYPGQPHVLARYMGIENETKLRQGRLIAISWGILVYYGAMTAGLSARILLPDISDPEHALMDLSVKLLHPVLAGIILAAIFAAIKSTADSQLLVASSAVARDLYQKIYNKEANQDKLVLVSRLTVVVLGICATIFAVLDIKVIFWFVLYAWSGLGASFGPVLILSLFWEKANRWGALAGMLVGFTTTIFWKMYLSDLIYELVPAFVFALLAAVIVSMITNEKKEVT